MEPDPSTLLRTGVGWYLYAFLPAGIDPSAGEAQPMPGIDGHSPLRLVVEAGVAALLSRVPLAEFGEEPLRRNMEDLRWLGDKVRFHEAIVEAALAKGPLLPFKFGTIFLDLDSIRQVIRRNARSLHESLAFLRDKVEWGVKGFTDLATVRAAVLGSDSALLALSREASARPPGQAFFLKRKIEESASTKSREREDVLCREALEIVRGSVVAVLEHSPLVAEARHGERIALNLAALVRREQVATFIAEVGRYNRAHGEEGVRLVASGPWPPYHFVPRLDDDR